MRSSGWNSEGVNWHETPGFCDWEDRQNKLTQKKDLLVRFNEIICWETFRP